MNLGMGSLTNRCISLSSFNIPGGNNTTTSDLWQPATHNFVGCSYAEIVCFQREGCRQMNLGAKFLSLQGVPGESNGMDAKCYL